ncbi:MAG: peptidylprolyl isomerase [Candidatus Omnitrophica bacterium]|nr:peptidylprolyl isomerase [Candidatus Omnitrophota bacterium]
MGKAKKGDKVKVHYTGKLNDGQVFDSSEGRDPLEFVLGSGKVIPGFEKAIEGMEENETRTINVPSAEGYGPRRDEMVIEVSKEQLPPDIKLELGGQLGMSTPDGKEFVVTIVELKEESIKVDGNHPLAGKDLVFDVTLDSIG